jgi:hypothetical protein
MKQNNKKHYFPLLIMVFLGASTMTVDAQDEVPNYPVLQELEGGGMTCLQEGEDGSYYIACRGYYKDTLKFNGGANYVVFGEELDLEIPPELIFKVVKFDEDDNIVAEKEMYVDTISDNRSKMALEYIKYDGENIIVDCEFWAVSLNVGEDNFVIDNGVRVGRQILIALDSESLEYQNHFEVGVGWEQQGIQNWDVKDGFVYFRHIANEFFVVNHDTIRFEHDFYPGLPSINLFKFDYRNDELVWNKVLSYGYLTYPSFFGVDVGDDDRIYISGGYYGAPLYFMGDTLNQVVDGQIEDYLFISGSVIVVGSDGELVDHYHMQNAFAHAFDVKTIDDYTYILIQAKGNNIIYRDHEIPLDTTNNKKNNLILKVDKNGNYIDHWIAFSDCSIIYNFMRKTNENNLQLFGIYYDAFNDCSKTTAEGIPFVNDDKSNSSVLTLNADLEVIENRIFYGESLKGAPDDNDISKKANYVSYDWTKLLVKSLISNVESEIERDLSYNQVLYPNPTSGIFTLRDSEDIKIKKLEVYNIHGVLIVDSSPYELGDYIDISTHKPGTYFVKLITEHIPIIKKIIKL